MLQKKSSKMARAKSLLVLPLLCTAVLAFAETKYVPVESKDSEISQNVVKTTDDNVLVLVNGKRVKSLDGIDPNTIESIVVIKDKDKMKQYGKASEGKDGVIVVKLKDGVEMQKESIEKLSIRGNNGVIVLKSEDGAETQKESAEKVAIRGNNGHVLFVVDGQIVKSIDNITPDMIESMEVIKDKKQLKKYGKEAKGKDGVIEMKLKH